MQRFFVHLPLRIDITIEEKTLVHQMTKVLRMQQGDHCILFDGDGSETEYEISTITKKGIALRGVNRTFPQTEPTKHIVLYQALPNKYEKIEYILQKGVEIGIRTFVFFRSERSQKLSISEAKKERFFAIVKEALEQCGGMVMPEISFLDTPPYTAEGPHITLDTMENVGNEALSSLQHVGLWVGPEGGWSPQERQKMKDNSFIFVRFGERILRTETAGVAIGFHLLHL